MASTTFIPMLDPEGNARLVPINQVESAKKAGGRVARKFMAPDGTKRWIPAEHTAEAIKAGGIPVPDTGDIPYKSSGHTILDLYEKAVEPYTRIEDAGPDKWNPREAVKAVGNIGAGGLGLILHPINTLESIGGMITAPAEMLTGTPFKKTIPGELIESLRSHPLENIEAGIGQAGAVGLGELGGAAAARLEVPRKVGEILTKTTPKETAELVRKTAAENREAIEKTAAENAKKEAERRKDLAKYFEKTQEAKRANIEAGAGVARKEALPRGV